MCIFPKIELTSKEFKQKQESGEHIHYVCAPACGSSDEAQPKRGREDPSEGPNKRARGDELAVCKLIFCLLCLINNFIILKRLLVLRGVLRQFASSGGTRTQLTTRCKGDLRRLHLPHHRPRQILLVMCRPLWVLLDKW